MVLVQSQQSLSYAAAVLCVRVCEKCQDDRTLNKQPQLRSETRDVRVFIGRGERVVISPVGAPAPDSAVNHGCLIRLSHTHPIHTHVSTNKGIPYSSRQGLLLL